MNCIWYPVITIKRSLHVLIAAPPPNPSFSTCFPFFIWALEGTHQLSGLFEVRSAGSVLPNSPLLIFVSRICLMIELLLQPIKLQYPFYAPAGWESLCIMAEQRDRLNAIARYLKAAQEKKQVQRLLGRTLQACDSLGNLQTEDTLDTQFCELLDTAQALRHEHEEQANDLAQAHIQVLQFTQRAEFEAKDLVSAAETRLQAEITDLTASIQSTARELRESQERYDQLIAYRDHLATLKN